MIRWASATRKERLAAIRKGWLHGLSAAEMAAGMGCTRNAVLGLAWRYGLSPATAAGWRWETATQRVYGYTRSVRVYRPRPHVHRPRVNRAVDPATRDALERLNAVTQPVAVIADTMGYSYATYRKWQRGAQNMGTAALACVDETVRRLR